MKAGDFERAAGIAALYRAVWSGQYPPYAPELREEGVCITSVPVSRIGFEYREPPNLVHTPFASELSWVIAQLLPHLAVAACGHAEMKTIERLAARARQHLQDGGCDDEDAEPLLVEVLDEACNMLGEVDEQALSSLHQRLGQLARSHALAISIREGGKSSRGRKP